jgi:hypothetical protein
LHIGTITEDNQAFDSADWGGALLRIIGQVVSTALGTSHGLE